jgi:hypothetical protein
VLGPARAVAGLQREHNARVGLFRTSWPGRRRWAGGGRCPPPAHAGATQPRPTEKMCSSPSFGRVTDLIRLPSGTS